MRYAVKRENALRAKLFYGEDAASYCPDTCYVPSMLLVDTNERCQVVYLKPSLDVMVTQHKLRPGDIIEKLNFVRHSQSIQSRVFIEVLELKVKDVVDGGAWPCPVKDFQILLKNQREVLPPIDDMVRVNLWHDTVPFYVKTPHETQRCLIDNTEVGNNFPTLRYLFDGHLLRPGFHPPLLLSVLRRTKLSYRRLGQKKFPTMCSLLVADTTGYCNLVIFDDANIEELCENCHPGSVIFVTGYQLSRAQYYFKPYTRERPPLCSMEIKIDGVLSDGESEVCKSKVRIFNNIPSSRNLNKMSRFYLDSLRFVSDFKSDQNKNDADVAGVIVGISRYCRSPTRKPNATGKHFVTRCLEIYDPLNDSYIFADIFINGRLKIHEAAEIGDYIILTFMYADESHTWVLDCPRIHVVSSENTEIFIMKRDSSAALGVQYLPDSYVRRFAEMMLEVGEVTDFERPTWVGGSGAYPITQLPQKYIDCLPETIQLDCVQRLKKMSLYEVQCVGVYASVVSVEYCTVDMLHVDKFLNTTWTDGRVQLLYEDKCLRKVTEAVPIWGSKQPNFSTFSYVDLDTAKAAQVQQLLQFPSDTLLETTTSATCDITRKDNLQLLRYFRILILSKERDVAYQCLFLPPRGLHSQPKDLLDIIYLGYFTHDPETTYFLHSNCLSFSEKEIRSLSTDTAEIKNAVPFFVLQAYKPLAGDVEVVLSRAVNSEPTAFTQYSS